MSLSRPSSFLLILASLFSLVFLRCERNDLFEISNAKFSFSNELKVQYLDGTDYVDVPYSGVYFGSTPFTPSTPISMQFQMVNTTDDYDIQCTYFNVSAGKGFSGYVTTPLTVSIGSNFPFSVSFTPVAIGTFSDYVMIEFQLINPTTSEVVSGTRQISFQVVATGT